MLIGGKTLQEIQDMPRSKMIAHMQKYNHPDFGKDDGGKSLKMREFRIFFSHTETDSITIEATTEEEAKEEFFGKLMGFDNVEIINIEEVE